MPVFSKLTLLLLVYSATLGLLIVDESDNVIVPLFLAVYAGVPVAYIAVFLSPVSSIFPVFSSTTPDASVESGLYDSATESVWGSSIVPVFFIACVVEPSEYIAIELVPIVILPAFSSKESPTPYIAVDLFPIVIIPVVLLWSSPNFP